MKFRLCGLQTETERNSVKIEFHLTEFRFHLFPLSKFLKVLFPFVSVKTYCEVCHFRSYPDNGVERSSCLCTRGTNRVAGQYVLCAAEAATCYGKLRYAVMSTCAVMLEAARTSVG